MKPKLPELLAPAGNMEKLKMAVTYGADAVYLAGREFGMRVAAGNFDESELVEAVSYCHSRDVRVYLTLNTIPYPDEMPRLLETVRSLPALGVDAVIVADAGVFSLVRKYAPDVAVHMSTQAGITNAESANFWHSLGASRVILARELSISDIADIRRHTDPSLELECFVHGAMCVSFSGRCLLSQYMTGRDANRGACAQCCRYRYFLREEIREGQYFEIVDEPEGSYILNSKDLCAVSFLRELMDVGISSFKIEGRGKSSYYAAVTTNAYRLALQDLEADRPYDSRLLQELEKTSHREFSDGFFHENPDSIRTETRHSGYIREWDVVALVESSEEGGSAALLQKNRFASGSEAELLIPGLLPLSITLGELWDEEGTPISEAIHPGMRVKTRLPRAVPPLSIIRTRRTLRERAKGGAES